MKDLIPAAASLLQPVPLAWVGRLSDSLHASVAAVAGRTKRHVEAVFVCLLDERDTTEAVLSQVLL